MARRIGGTAFLRVDGVTYPLRGNLTVSPTMVERTMVAGLDYVHGFLETPRVPFIEGDVTLVPELSTDDVAAVDNSTVQVELNNGHTYVLKEAMCKSAFDINGHDGFIRVRFEGTDCIEMF